MTEADLYPYVSALLSQYGFITKGECMKIDVVGMKGEGDNLEVSVVEMKLVPNIKVLCQAHRLKRMKVAHFVSIAVPIPDSRQGKKRANAIKTIKQILPICKELNIGLIVVDMSIKSASYMFHPLKGVIQPKGYFRYVKREYDGRTGDQNIGGTTGVKLVTAFKERSIRIARTLMGGRLKTSEIKEQSGVAEATSMLNANVMDWFKRYERGVYGLSEIGLKAIREDYADVVRLQVEAEENS